MGALIDAALIRRLGEDYAKTPLWAALSKHFDTTTRLEVSFWDMGLTP